LTDSALDHCNSFDCFFEAIRANRFSALTLIDFSNNYHTVDDDKEWHDQFIDAILNQERDSISNYPKDDFRVLDDISEHEGGDDDFDRLGSPKSGSVNPSNGNSVISSKKHNFVKAPRTKKGKKEEEHKTELYDIQFNFIETIILTTSNEDIEADYMNLITVPDNKYDQTEDL